MRALLLVLCLITTPAIAADQFDLVCQGQYRERINAKPKASTNRYRLDLDQKSWCNGDCKEVRQIASIEAGKIVLSRSDPSDGVSPLSYHEIDRVSGSYKFYANGGGFYWDEEGSCRKEPFSGFPPRKF